MSPAEVYGQYGVIGVSLVVLGFVVRHLFARIEAAHNQAIARLVESKTLETQRADRNEAALAAANSATIERTIPAVLEMLDVTKELVVLTTQLKTLIESERRRE